MSNMIKDTFHLGEAFFNAEAITRAKVANKVTFGTLFEKTTDAYGREVLKKVSDNSVVFGGAVVALEKLCGVNAKFKPATLNDIYHLPVSGATGKNDVIALFGCGTGGSGLLFDSVVAPKITQRNIIDQIPMRYGSMLTDEDADKYFFKIPNPEDPGTFSWYLKEFDAPPVITSYWKDAIDSDSDGTEITGEIYQDESGRGFETLAEFNFSLNEFDIKEYFEATNNMALARYNTFGFYLGEKVESANEYANVRLFSAVTFKNRDVSIETSSKYVYRVYSLI